MPAGGSVLVYHSVHACLELRTHRPRASASSLPTLNLECSTLTCLSPLTPLFPLDRSHSPVSPLFPLHAQEQGRTPCTLLPALTEHGQIGPGQELRSLRPHVTFPPTSHEPLSRNSSLPHTSAKLSRQRLCFLSLPQRRGEGGAGNMLTKRSTGGPFSRFSSHIWGPSSRAHLPPSLLILKLESR
jgi:hypothetical protein